MENASGHARVLPWSREIALSGSGAARVILFSGFGSGPETLRDLGQHLRDSVGASVLVCGLPRHGGEAREFLSSRGWHYFREAEARFLAFWKERGVPVLLGGYSTGALLAVEIAAHHPGKVAGLVLASPALRLAKRSREVAGYTIGSVYYLAIPLGLLTTVLALAWRGHRRGWGRRRRLLQALGSTAVFASAALGLRSVTVPLSDGGPVVRDGEEIHLPHYARASLLTGSTLVPLQLAARWRLRRTALPVCIVFGERDATVDVTFGTLRAAESPNTEWHVVPDAPHRVVTMTECLAVISAFVARTQAPPASTPQPPEP